MLWMLCGPAVPADRRRLHDGRDMVEADAASDRMMANTVRYTLKGLAVEPGVVVEGMPVAAMSIPRFNERLWQSKGSQGHVIHGGILPGRPEVAISTKAGPPAR